MMVQYLSQTIFLLLISYSLCGLGQPVSIINHCPEELPGTATRCAEVEGGRCYYYMGNAANRDWLAAEKECHTIGAYLPVFGVKRDYDTFRQLRTLWLDLKARSLPIGLYFDASKYNKKKVSDSVKGWRWIDGSALHYTKWAVLNPDVNPKSLYAYDYDDWFDAESNVYSPVFLCQNFCNTTAPPPKPTPKPPSPEPGNNSNCSTCSTPGCTLAAAYLLQSMNTSVDPCTDFYDYACQGWIEKHPIPDTKSRYFAVDVLQEVVTSQIRPLLEDPTNTNARPIEMAKQFYKTCMDTSRRNEKKSSEVLAELKTLGPMPILSPVGQHCSLNLTKLLGTVHKQYWTAMSFFLLYANPDSKHSSRVILYMDQGGNSLGLGTQNYFLDDKNAHIIEALKKMMKSTVTAIGEDNNLTIADPQKDIDDILEFDKQFAKILIPWGSPARKNKTALYNKVKVEELNKIGPFIDWNVYFDIVLPDDFKTSFNENSEIVVANLTYIHDLSNLLQNTDCRVKVNYILWCLLDKLLGRTRRTYPSVMGERYDAIGQEFMKVYSGQAAKPKLAEGCTYVTAWKMSDAVDAMYVRKHFKEKGRAVAEEMMQHIVSAFKNNVKGLDWMDQITKQYALEKADNVLFVLGFPDRAINDTLLEKHYATLSFHKNASMLRMVQGITEFQYAEKLLQTTQPTNRADWWLSASVINAGYSWTANSILFTAASLQRPFFDADYPKAVNYGSVGMTMGHELIHGFDSGGSQYGKDGNLNNWWDDATAKSYNTKTQCLVAQYGNTEVEGTGLKISGDRTINENIADNGGLRQAYAAYQMAMQGKEEPRLPGLQSFTPDQIFFLSVAQHYCGSDTVEQRKQQVMTWGHSPDKYRVNLPFANYPQFSKTFQCQPGSPMNPQKRCKVW